MGGRTTSNSALTSAVIPILVKQPVANHLIEMVAGSAVIINEEGWMLTTHHMKDRLARGGPRFGMDRLQVTEGSLRENSDADLLIGRLDGFDGASLQMYPAFRQADPNPGMHLTLVGFPYSPVPATNNGPVQVRIEGQLCRDMTVEGGAYSPYIATTTQAPEGTSGGPYIDDQGNICGLQSRTLTLNQDEFLGLCPDSAETLVSGDQAIQVSIATAPQVLINELQGAGINFRLAAAQ